MFVIGDESFRTRRSDLTWQLMEFNAAQRLATTKGDDEAAVAKRLAGGNRLLGAMYALTKRIIAKDEWDRFSEYMADADLPEGAFENAIGEAIANLGAEETSFPKEPSGPSSEQPTRTVVKSQHVSFK